MENPISFRTLESTSLKDSIPHANREISFVACAFIARVFGDSRNQFDTTVFAFAHKTLPVLGIQFHREYFISSGQTTWERFLSLGARC